MPDESQIDDTKKATENGLDAEVQDVLVKKDFEELGHGEPIREKIGELTLTPLDEVTPAMIESRQLFSLFSSPEDAKPLTSEQIEIAKVVIEVFQRDNVEFREEITKKNSEFEKESLEKGFPQNAEWSRKQKQDPQSDRYQYEHLGEKAKIVGMIGVSPFGAEGRFKVGFKVVHMRGEDNREIEGRAYIFDMPEVVKEERLNDPSPDSMDNAWLLGRKDGKFQVVGKLGEIHRLTDGDVTGFLSRRRFKDPVEVSPMGGGHVGWLDKPSKAA